jgi:hypothetical protein
MEQTPEWNIFTTRNGKDIVDPSLDALADELSDLLLATTTYDPEHPNAWLRVGFGNGEVHVLDLYQEREARYAIYADQDDVAPFIEAGPLDCTWGEAVQLCMYLKCGSLLQLRSWFGLNCGILKQES